MSIVLQRDAVTGPPANERTLAGHYRADREADRVVGKANKRWNERRRCRLPFVAPDRGRICPGLSIDVSAANQVRPRALARRSIGQMDAVIEELWWTRNIPR